jgi:hypothetical protein
MLPSLKEKIHSGRTPSYTVSTFGKARLPADLVFKLCKQMIEAPEVIEAVVHRLSIRDLNPPRSLSGEEVSIGRGHLWPRAIFSARIHLNYSAL